MASVDLNEFQWQMLLSLVDQMSTMFLCATNRDIPMPLVSSGVEHGNLRELALARMKDLGTQCRDVRTREVGIQEIHHKVRPYEVGVLIWILSWVFCWLLSDCIIL